MVDTEEVIKAALVTVVVPCFNHGNYLAETLDSVAAQIYSNWECIIVDDGSLDNTAAVAATYLSKDARFSYIHQENTGLPSARNAGIRAAKGIYILPLDADDTIDTKYIQLSVKAFKEQPATKLVYCLAKKFGYENHLWDLGKYNYARMLSENCIFCSAVFKKSDWEKTGGYNIQLVHGWEDWAFWLKLLDEDSVVFQIPQVLFFYRTQLTSMVKSMPENYREETRWQIFRENEKAYQKFYPSPQNIFISNETLRELNTKILGSSSYKLGNFFLKPFSWLKNRIWHNIKTIE